MFCPCNGCELRHVFTANGVTHRCHSNCPNDKNNEGYLAWKASLPQKDEALCYEMAHAALAKVKFQRRARKDTRVFRCAAQ